MMMLTTLRRSGGIDALAGQLAVPPALAARIAAAGLVSVLGGMRDYFDAAGGGGPGLAALAALLDGLGGGRLAAAVLMPGRCDPAPGRALLEALHGSADFAPRLIARDAAHAGIDPHAISDALPLIAMLIGGYFAVKVAEPGRDPAELGAEVALLLDDPDEETPAPVADNA